MRTTINQTTARAVVVATLLLGLLAGGLAAGAREAEARSCGYCPATTTAALNLRAGPSMDAPVILVIPAGAEVGVDRTDGSTNGYLPVLYQWIFAWAHQDYLTSDDVIPAPTATVAEPLNLRAGPSTSEKVLLVMPAGATVTLTGVQVNGFLSVSYQGTEGFASAAYLVF
jgi:D-alanyl-D-alanine carboxypeptidase